jgi:hypothetical protein
MFSEDFYPMPYEAIALVLAVVRSLQGYMIRFKAELDALFTRSSVASTSGGEASGPRFPSLMHYKETYGEQLGALKALTS